MTRILTLCLLALAMVGCAHEPRDLALYDHGTPDEAFAAACEDGRIGACDAAGGPGIGLEEARAVAQRAVRSVRLDDDADRRLYGEREHYRSLWPSGGVGDCDELA